MEETLGFRSLTNWPCQLRIPTAILPILPSDKQQRNTIMDPYKVTLLYALGSESFQSSSQKTKSLSGVCRTKR